MYPYGYPSVPPPPLPSTTGAQTPPTTQPYPGYPGSYTPYGYPPAPQQLQQQMQQQQAIASQQQQQQQQQQIQQAAALPSPGTAQQQQVQAGADGRPLNALALAAASGLHEMERERERAEQQAQQQQVVDDVKPQVGGSAPGSAAGSSAGSTPYGSFDPAQAQQAMAAYWSMAGQPYAASAYQNAALQAQQQQLAAQQAQAQAAALSGTAPRRPAGGHTAPPLLPQHSAAQTPADDPASRHSHSHDPSHPTHHGSLARHQHRHAYAPYSLPSTADHSLANSPASSPKHTSDGAVVDHNVAAAAAAAAVGLADPHSATSSGTSSPFPPLHPAAGLVPGIGMASQPGHGQQHAIGQLQQQLAYQLTPSTSPVLGPLKGLTLMSAQVSRAPSRATSPVHLPPLRLPGAEGTGTSGDNSASNSRAATPDAIEATKHGLDHGRHTASTHLHHVRAHPYRSQPGSPVLAAQGSSRPGTASRGSGQGQVSDERHAACGYASQPASAPSSRPTSPAAAQQQRQQQAFAALGGVAEAPRE
ncbi:hypothetical protein JCM10049v2_007479 [Rhodotorula toruloides]